MSGPHQTGGRIQKHPRALLRRQGPIRRRRQEAAAAPSRCGGHRLARQGRLCCGSLHCPGRRGLPGGPGRCSRGGRPGCGRRRGRRVRRRPPPHTAPQVVHGVVAPGSVARGLRQHSRCVRRSSRCACRRAWDLQRRPFRPAEGCSRAGCFRIQCCGGWRRRRPADRYRSGRSRRYRWHPGGGGDLGDPLRGK